MVVECAQALLDIDYGSYPYVSLVLPDRSRSLPGRRYRPNQVDTVIGVFKAYSSRVGSGPFPTELFDETGNEIRERGREYGTTTGRARRVLVRRRGGASGRKAQRRDRRLP
ncbi:MAG: adenylosuccinate synthetase [Thermomicrobiales bacterium]